MADIGFYHLLTMTLDRALPKLLERAVAGGARVVVVAGSEERVDHLNNLLWTYDDAAFLPHGASRDGNPARQPVWLAASDENPNGAKFVMLVDGARADLARYGRCFDIFDGNDEEAVAAARRRWSEAKAAGHTLTYWQQTDKGWEKKAEA
ncbi:MAG: DNA polymerase III subunit chi [Stellaceae bacterium]